MAGHGSGSINTKLDKLRSAGEHQEYVCKMLSNTLEDLQKAKENVAPNRARQRQNLLNKVVHQTALAQETLQKTSDAWRGATNVNFAVKQRVQEAPPETCTHEGLVEKLQSYNDSHARGENPTPTGPHMDCDNLCSTRGGHVVRLRTIQVQGHLIPQPLNGAWYQTSEAVKILYDLKQENKRIAKRVIEEWRSQTPPWIDISYQTLMVKLSKVEEVVLNTKCSVDEAIKQHIRDRVAVDKPAVGGPSYYMSSDKFVHAMFNSNRQEEASSKATAAMVLQNAKASVYEARGLRPPTAAVAKNTVEKYWQHMGGKQFPLRTQVSERSHARVQAAHSEMHLLSYFFTVLHTHIMVAPVGEGKDPPPNNWAARLVREFWKVPVMPIDPSCLLNSDTKTLGVKLNPSGKERLCYYVVQKEDDLSGKTVSYWKAGHDRKDRWVFIESFDVMSGDGRWGAFCWVSPVHVKPCARFRSGALWRPQNVFF